ncbi:MAG: DUF1285 domain-containing protein [Pseudomonadales bacterium]|nr:DUF1285 domain-containing protein [Pseudomonadales bacterium]MBO6595122.1 DUF1285 domain-containing protein [Pseudomonadales bacterium]MBO6821319.1 DUF1285 domain-containing protein [Pseudomonadales bacterium]
MELPYSLLSELEKVPEKSLPPVHLWHPEHEKDIDLIIQKDGTWQYQGSPIKRPRLLKLFASVLRRDDNDYFLVTPVEKCRIEVEDVPFQGILMDADGEGPLQQLTVTTDMGDRILIGEKHPLRIQQVGDEWIPYVMVRSGLEARLNRNVYYQLADLMVESEDPKTSERWLSVWSDGQSFPMMLA